MRQASTTHTLNERTELEERRNVLRRRLYSWMEARNSYIPSTSDNHATTSAKSPHVTTGDCLPDTETVHLKLPSTLPASIQKHCPFKLDRIECRFRLAQAEDSLSELCCLLCVTMCLRHYKLKQIGMSQCAGMRACNLINRFNDKVSQCMERYRVTHNALYALDPMEECRIRLLELKDEDIRPPGRSDDESEGFRELSWIWVALRHYGTGQVSSPERGPLTDEELDGCEYMK